jgi:DNA-binding transcriptional MerR regulator
MGVDGERESAQRDYEREYSGRRYRIGEFAAMTGMSASRIRFYEKQGLFGGAKEQNGYRYFTPQDAFRANAFRVLLQYGFSVDMAIEMIDSRQESGEFRCSLVAQHEALERQAELLRYRTERIERALDLLDMPDPANLPPASRFEIVDMEDWLYVEASHGADFSVSVENSEVIAHFYEMLHVTNCIRIIPAADLLGNGPTVSPNYGNGFRASEGWRIQPEDMPRVRRLVMGKCLVARRMLTRAESLSRESYTPALEFLAEHGYRVRADALLLPGFLNLDGEGSDVETLYVPIA